MDSNTFDQLTRHLRARRSRRAGLLLLTGGVLGGFGIHEPNETLGKHKKRKKKVTLCLNGQTISVPKKNQGTFLGAGAAVGGCPGGGGPAPECTEAGDCASFLCVNSTCETCQSDADCGRDWAGQCYCLNGSGQCFSIDNFDLVTGGCQHCPPEALDCKPYEDDYYECKMPCGWMPA